MRQALESQATPAVDLLVVAYETLTAPEQDEALSRCQELRLKRDADTRSVSERMLASLQRVVESTGASPGELRSEDYRAAIKAEIEKGGTGIEPISRVIKHFGSWRLAKEALSLSADSTALQIEARFACRRLGRVWRYPDEVLRDSLRRCADELGYPPQVGEFRAWRQREIELAQAQGNRDLHLPSLNSYRRRNSFWKDTLRIFLDGDLLDEGDKGNRKSEEDK